MPLVGNKVDPMTKENKKTTLRVVSEEKSSQNVASFMVGTADDADDILLYLVNAMCDQPQVMEVFTLFSSFSGYKINLKKCAFLP